MKNKLNTFSKEENLQNKFRIKIEEIINYIKDYSEYDVLAHFYFCYKISYGERENREERWLKSKKIMYLQTLFSCIDKKSSNIKKLTKFNLEKIETFIDELHTLTIQYDLIRNQKSELNQEEEDYVIHAESFRDWSGKRYDVFEIQHHKDLLGCLSEEFNSTYNFTLDDLYYGIEQLKNNFYFEFATHIKLLRAIIKDSDFPREGILEINEDGSLANIPKSFTPKKAKQLQEYISTIFGLKLVDIQSNTKWTTKFLDRFIIDSNECEKFTKNINIQEWNKLLNNMKYKPLAKIENKYYLLLEQKFYDNFDKAVINGICKKHKDKEQKIRAKFTSNIEKVVVRYFNNILGKQESYIKNFYTYKNKILENDILIKYDNNIFIIEVKAGNFTPKLASDDFNSHKEALNNLLGKANEQQNTLEMCLLENKKVCIYDSNNKKTRNKKADIIVNDDTRIFKIIITAEGFNDIEARIDKVKILTLSENTLVFCLDDLRVYSDYFEKHPSYFIQYLLQRNKAIGNKNIDFVDELYHLGMWVEYNFYNEYINGYLNNFKKENNITEEFGMVSIFGEDWMDKIDDYYNNLFFKQKVLEKPYRSIPKEVKKIIDFCEQNSVIEKHTYLSIFLLNLDPETLQQTEEIILDSREFYRKNNRPKYRLYVIKKEG